MSQETTVYLPHARIDFDSEWSVQWWALELGATEEEVCEAIGRVGPIAEDVRRYLEK